jgi:hypothetical protein
MKFRWRMTNVTKHGYRMPFHHYHRYITHNVLNVTVMASFIIIIIIIIILTFGRPMRRPT